MIYSRGKSLDNHRKCAISSQISVVWCAAQAAGSAGLAQVDESAEVD